MMFGSWGWDIPGIACSHRRVAVVWALAGGQWEVGPEKILSREFRGVRGGIQEGAPLLGVWI